MPWPSGTVEHDRDARSAEAQKLSHSDTVLTHACPSLHGRVHACQMSRYMCFFSLYVCFALHSMSVDMFVMLLIFRHAHIAFSETPESLRKRKIKESIADSVRNISIMAFPHW